MIARLGFVPVGPASRPDENAAGAIAWIAAHCRKVAEAHMALAEKAEGLMDQFTDNRRFRSGLRAFARHQRRLAWQHLEMALRAEAAWRTGCHDFDLADVVSA
jgi:hypothetical protein